MSRLACTLVVLSSLVGCAPTIRSAVPMGSSNGSTFLLAEGENMPKGLYACSAPQGGKPVCKLATVETR